MRLRRDNDLRFGEQTCLVALGGNAIQRGNNFFSKEAVKEAVCAVTNVFSKKLLIAHGNGPQVGVLEARYRQEVKDGVIEMPPFHKIIEETQNVIGGMVVKEIEANLDWRDSHLVVTHVVVDPDLGKPVKGIGEWVDDIRILFDQGVMEDRIRMSPDGRDLFREMVPSPEPLEVRQLSAIRSSLGDENIVICGGGGGIPVIRENGGSLLTLVEERAVIDKDSTASLIARDVQANVFVILTKVPGFIDGYGKDGARLVPRIRSGEVDSWIARNKVGGGSMNPKLLAMKNFVGEDPDRLGIITDIRNFVGLAKAREAEAIPKYDFLSRATVVMAG